MPRVAEVVFGPSSHRECSYDGERTFVLEGAARRIDKDQSHKECVHRGRGGRVRMSRVS